jgi:hypothetical protein
VAAAGVATRHRLPTLLLVVVELLMEIALLVVEQVVVEALVLNHLVMVKTECLALAEVVAVDHTQELLDPVDLVDLVS